MKFNLMTKAKDALHWGKYMAKAKQPEILMAGGFIFGALAIAATVYGTVKAVPKVDEMKEELHAIDYRETEAFKEFVERQKAHREELGMEPFEEPEAKSKKKVAASYVLKIAANYIPSLTLSLLSAGCFLGAYKTLDSRLVGMTVAYEGVVASYNKYRAKVKEKFGEGVDKELYYGDNAKQIVKNDPETGKEIVEFTPNVEKGAPWITPYSFTYVNESRHPGFDLMQVTNDQRYWNDKLDQIGYIEANTIYETMPGHKGEHKGEWCGVGWISKKWQRRLKDLGIMPEDYPGDGYISFGVLDGEGGLQAEYWRNGQSNEVVMDFNVDGTIYKFITAINNYEDLVAEKVDDDAAKRR